MKLDCHGPRICQLLPPHGISRPGTSMPMAVAEIGVWRQCRQRRRGDSLLHFRRSLHQARIPVLVQLRDKLAPAMRVRYREPWTHRFHFRPRRSQLFRESLSQTPARTGCSPATAVAPASLHQVVWQETLMTGWRLLPAVTKMRRTSSGDSASGPDGRCTPSASAANATSTLPFTRTLGAMVLTLTA